MENKNNVENKKGGLFAGIKGLVNGGKKKVAEFKEKHPVAYKVIGGICVAGTAVGAGVIAYNVAKNADEKNKSELVNVPLLNDNDHANNNGNEPYMATSESVSDQEDWEQNKDNWTKVISVANDLNLKPGSEFGDDYHIYKDDNGITQVAHITDDGTYHYPPVANSDNGSETANE